MNTTTILTVAGIVVAALLTLFGVLIGHLFGRVAKLENDVKAARDEVQEERDYAARLWTYTRKLLDLYFRNRKDGAPDPGEIPGRA